MAWKRWNGMVNFKKETFFFAFFVKLYDNLNMQTNCVALSIKLLPFLVVQVELLTQFAWLDGQRNWNTNWECVVETVVQRWQPLDLVIFYSLRSGAASHDIGACNSSMARLLERLSERAMIDGTDNCGNIRTTKRGGGKQAGKAQRSKSIYVEWEGGGAEKTRTCLHIAAPRVPLPRHTYLSPQLLSYCTTCAAHIVMPQSSYRTNPCDVCSNFGAVNFENRKWHICMTAQFVKYSTMNPRMCV